MQKYLDSEIIYGSTEGNSALITQLDEEGSKEYIESGNILVNDLDKSLFIPEYIEFEFPVSTALLRSINQTSEFNGETIMNYYGMVEFINEDREYEYGFLMELKPNKQGKWKLLKANKKAYKRSTQIITSPGDLYINRALDQDMEFELY